MNINYNNRITLRWNNWFRRFFILPKMRKALRNKEFTLLSNNCNGGFIYHDLGLQFLSPTINMFFYHDHYLTKNKIAFVNHPYPQYKSAVYIPGYEAEGLGLLNQYVNCFGRRKYDYFNFVEWFNVYCGR